ncbi:ribosomal protein S16 [Metschnikowia bicuspidata var. bicuspidata NRRL YB-4993]|uniref:Ribosomal protein S16 n=1 Tax=Metschnikowia bicuspidata var. bicuspidata NRRL YB-4993 TaxID=869754 RepID=A0A1A0HI85_9ASCO|nr:ribosomal protein S16 [Metschnikowia bicuspidata var. bicuspidata NRRL YB-4993]OBA23711.1 ribosomal protein S16 [Metschnikowia bicuspidata var. bicuspidata NRRL YB-4993]
MSVKSTPIKIRLARFGRKHQPVYNIVVARIRSARNSLPIEVLGTYNPITVPLTPDEKARNVQPYKHIELDFHRTKYWLGVGALTSDRVAFLLKRAGLLPELWPKENKLTQVISKRVSQEPTIETEEKKDFFRPRD